MNAPTVNRTHVRTHIRTYALTHAHEHAEGWRPGKGADTVRGPGLSHPQVAGTRLGREVPGEWSTLRTSRRTGSSPPPPAAPGSLHGFRLAAGPIRAAQRSPRGPRRGPGASRPCRPWRPRGRPPAGAGHIWAGHRLPELRAQPGARRRSRRAGSGQRISMDPLDIRSVASASDLCCFQNAHTNCKYREYKSVVVSRFSWTNVVLQNNIHIKISMYKVYDIITEIIKICYIRKCFFSIVLPYEKLVRTKCIQVPKSSPIPVHECRLILMSLLYAVFFNP